MQRKNVMALSGIMLFVFISGLVVGTMYVHQGSILGIQQNNEFVDKVVVTLYKVQQDPSLVTNGWTYIGVAQDGRYTYQYITHNKITNAGQVWAQGQISGTPAATKAIYIGLSSDTGAPVATDTTIPTEMTNNGLSRATGTYISGTVALTGVITWTVAYTWTASGASTIAKAGLFTTSGYNNPTLYAENTFAAATLASNDTISLTWSLVSSGA